MNKLGIIIKREYLTKVRNKSFLIITFLGPILFVALMIAPTLLAINSDKIDSKKVIAVLDETGWFYNKFDNTEVNTFTYHDETKNLDELKKLVFEDVYDAVLYIPGTSLNVPVNAKLFSNKQISMTLSSYIENTMKKEVEHKKLLASGIDPDIVKSATTNINISNIRMDSDNIEKTRYTELESIIGLLLAFVIYFLVFLFSSQVLRSIIAEKTNRIVEIIISSVRPFELMMGKIIGNAMVGLTQFAAWIILTLIIYLVASGVILGPEIISPTGTIMTQEISKLTETTASQDIMLEAVNMIQSINFSAILWSFLFYFLFGFLLYAALFAAVGGMVDSETDSNQFVTILTIPLILAIVCSPVMIENPESNLALWMSMIPFTSPIAMMIRIPFGIPYWQLGISITILILTFIFTTWIAAKIYRTGILMYGKKPTFKEIMKWLKY